MMNKNAASADCLFELGLEELPPKAMQALSQGFAQGMRQALVDAELEHGEIHAFAAPRRLALRIESVARRQEDSIEILRGPPTHIALDEDGNPTKAATAFAKKCGIPFSDLERETTDKGEWLIHRAERSGQPVESLAQGLLEQAIGKLPIPKRMRWGNSDESFVRPLHWLVAMVGDAVLDVSLFGIAAGNETRGHRFHAPAATVISRPSEYASLLMSLYVVADFNERQSRVAAAVAEAADTLGGSVAEDIELLDEVTALVDWPVAVSGTFDRRFLALPEEVLSSTLKVHQRYFPVLGKSGTSTEHFITVANIESVDPAQVKLGNERVVAPRLADAEFFWNNDREQPLATRRAALDKIVYQRELGSLGEKTARVVRLCETVGSLANLDASLAKSAAELSRCDLVTDMVGEFPELQGVMGAYYAEADGTDPRIASAIRAFYQPRFAGDLIADSSTARIVAIADKVDTLAGIFAVGKRPTGNRDPFGLRRAALGLIRTLIEGQIELDLPALLSEAVALQPVDVSDHPELVDDLYDFVVERLRNYEQQQLCAGQPDWFEAVAARRPHSLLDFHQRLEAVSTFVEQPAAEALAAANKRIANILRSAGTDANGSLDPEALNGVAERKLLVAWQSISEAVAPGVAARHYKDVMLKLAELRDPVDAFFENVMVMADDVAVRRNRLALLAAVRGLFLEVADVSELAVKSD
ncbi:MAG: glycine--tRNA ligase subunit beta [Pseudomonadota bacterium]